MYKLLLICSLLFSLGADAQVGIKLVTTIPQNRISERNTNNNLFPFLSGVGVDYWFRLKKYRLEFFPSLQFQYAHENVTLSDASKGALNWSVIDFTPIIQFYPLDFKNDCMCPTFSKQGQFLKKGLFVQLAPGIAYSNLKGKNTEVDHISNWMGIARAGMGIDIGVSDLITLSPAINYQFAQSLDWSSFFTSTASVNINVYSGLYLSARIGWRFDRKNY
jgi:hypothetical protein